MAVSSATADLPTGFPLILSPGIRAIHIKPTATSIDGPTKRTASQIEDPEEGPSGVKRKSDGHLRRILHYFDDATEANQDTKVNDRCKRLETLENDLYAGALLAEIVKASEGNLNQQYADTLEAMELVKNTPSLFDELRSAWSAKCYKEIRNLGNYLRFSWNYRWLTYFTFQKSCAALLGHL